MGESFTSYVVDNDKRFRDAISKASLVVQDFRVPFGLILSDFYKSEQAIWALTGPGLYPPFKHSDAVMRTTTNKKTGKTTTRYEGTAGGGESPYQHWKIKKYGFDYPLLIRTGSLQKSLSGPNNPGSISSVTKLSMAFGTSIAYGIYHQSDEPRSKIPLRKFLFIGPEAPQFATSDQQGRLNRWLGYINDWALKQTQKELA